MVESHQCPVGSYCCCQPELNSGRPKMTIATTTVSAVIKIDSHPGEAEFDGFGASTTPAIASPPERE
jgi:hypothetical protein